MQGAAGSDRVLLNASAVCGHLLAAGSVHLLLAGHRSRLFPDEMFEDLFPSGRGRPSVPGETVAAVMVLQALEGLSDREACRRLQTDVAWKAAAGLALTDGAFHPTVLTLWRNKLRASGRPDRVFDAVRELVDLTGAVAGRSRRVLDSTVLDDAVARQDTVTMPPTGPLHHRQERAHHQDQPPPRPAQSSPSPSPHTRVPARLPHASAHGRKNHRLDRPPSTKMPLPRDRQQPALAAAARSSRQPPTPHQPRTAPQRHPLGHRLTQPQTPDTRTRPRTTDPAPHHANTAGPANHLLSTLLGGWSEKGILPTQQVPDLRVCI